MLYLLYTLHAVTGVKKEPRGKTNTGCEIYCNSLFHWVHHGKKKKGGQVDFTREPLIVTRGSETELVFSVFHNTELSSYMSPKLGVIL